MSSHNPTPLPRRFVCLALVALVAAGPIGCGAGGAGAGEEPGEVISTGEGQAVIPRQELVNNGATEKGLAPLRKKAR